MIFRFLFCFLALLSVIPQGFSLPYLQPEIRSQAGVEFAIFVPTYNNDKWCVQNLESIINQTYPFWTIYIVDDNSTDRTNAFIKETIKAKKIEMKCVFIENKVRIGAVANRFKILHQIPPHKVIVDVDGDDTLHNPYVLQYLAQIYSNKNVWMTYGNYETDPPGYIVRTEPLPEKVIKNRTFRSHRFVTSHLRSYRARLFQLIEQKDLMYRGEFLPMAGDLAFMFAMLEMASQGHIHYIKEILYRYNAQNPLNDFRQNRKLQEKLAKHIRSRKPYPALKTLF